MCVGARNHLIDLEIGLIGECAFGGGRYDEVSLGAGLGQEVEQADTIDDARGPG